MALKLKKSLVEILRGNFHGVIHYLFINIFLSIGNYCCVRVSHALITGGHPITRASDYKDKNGNKYIIRVVTMKEYLTEKYGAPVTVTKVNIVSYILYFILLNH